MPSPSGSPNGLSANRVESGSPGDVLQLIRRGAATSRTDLARLTGLARSTISQRVDALIAHGLAVETDDGESTGGRPPKLLRLSTDDNVVLGVDLGATHCRLALMDIGGAVLAVREDPILISDGPDVVLGHVDRALHDLLESTGRPVETLRTIGIGVPGPVEFASGRLINPPIMPGWNEYAIPDFFTRRYDVRVLVDNDVNVLALGEQRLCYPDAQYLLFVKIGTGIGCGIIVDGRLHRGAQGSAGDIGHIRVSGHEEAACRCGNTACLEAVAGGGALAQRVTQLGYPAENGRAVVDLVAAGNVEALRLVRDAGRLIGEVLAGLVNFFNPETIVVGGVMARVHEQLLAGIREVIYRRSLPLATHDLEVLPSRSGEDAGVVGAGHLAIDHYLAPEYVNQALLR
ncbi:ROK family transcriptional regulator [Allonocardiopsis opalescens]|uniref:Putative NBD/HSP70 family sugar kinase n=1 Tax=Allonocardiopsis opalescens TaxID=1144618 RepID=A0A2T0QC77_9ACTN|nr:ROK family transcriptional regulator [Allonocardiopsis opalescens]PRY01556.1 putative NBD/HSP70 family sugar kinase [Allonocardiopsis opalescens]